jgi:phosphate:Na+ symporter
MALISQLFGGVGLFLLGVFLMTDGLKTAGGEALRGILVKFTGRPFTAFISGTGLTVLVQSSSATTLATIGFVSAGILSFSQAIGLVIGATLGTTSTGWLVSLVGLKFGIGKFAFLMVGLGAIARLVTHGRNAALALSVAGFGLMFVGIDSLQAGMVALSGSISAEQLPHGTLLGRGLLVIIGVVLTVIMQSSAAAIATTLAAFHSGVIDLEQGASLVIGQSIGTTFTSALAAMHATVPAKRTAFAHVLFSAIAGILAFATVPLFVVAIRKAADAIGWQPGAVVLAAFHSGFTLLAALLVLPAVGKFSAVIERFIPERHPSLTRRLDASVAELPDVAIEAVRRTLEDVLAAMISEIRQVLRTDVRSAPDYMNAVKNALKETRRFLGTGPSFSTKRDQFGSRVAVIHAWDHLTQLAEVIGKAPKPALPDAAARLEGPKRILMELLDKTESEAEQENAKSTLDTIRNRSQELAELRRRERAGLLEGAAQLSVDPGAAVRILKGLRWFDAVGYHVWRAFHHLMNIDSAEEAPQNGDLLEPDEFAVNNARAVV